MSFVTTKQLFDMLPADKAMAIGAFNVHNMEYTQAVVKAAEMRRMPVILMLGESMLEFADLTMLGTIAKTAAENSSVPVAVALDHGKNIENIQKCIDMGISVMVDGSALPYEENVLLTKHVCEMARKGGVSVEGELGSLAGVEDAGVRAAELLTDPELVPDFVARTGVDALAVAIGNCHGKYRKSPNLDMDRLKKISEKVDIPIVLHGGSDLPVKMSIEAINNGIRKFNVGTDLKYAFCEALYRILSENPMPFQPPETLGTARDEVCRVACEKIQLFQNGYTLDF